MRKFRLSIRIILWLSLAIFLARIAYLAVVPSGQVTYNNDFIKRSDFLSKFKPRERLGATEVGQQKLIGDPVYLALRTPRPFWQTKLSIWFKPEDQPLLEVGLLRDKELWRYELKPLYNRTIEELYRARQWGALEDEGVLLLQRRETYGSLKDFLAAPPSLSEVAVYNYDLPVHFRLADYKVGQETIVPWTIRGSYQFFTYIKNETLQVDFSVKDLNESKGADDIKAVLLNDQGQEIKTVAVADDGKNNVTRDLRLTADGLAEGVYRVELRAGDDIVTDKIISRQSKLSFSGKLWLSDMKAVDLSLFMTGRRLEAQTNNPSSRQAIHVGAEVLTLGQAYQKIILPLQATGALPVNLAHGDVILATDGVLAPTAAALFNPQTTEVTADFALADNINYIIAKYAPVKQDGEWLKAEVDFDLRLAARADGAYELMFSLPGLGLTAAAPSSVTLGRLQADLSGQTLSQFLGL